MSLRKMGAKVVVIGPPGSYTLPNFAGNYFTRPATLESDEATLISHEMKLEK